MSTKELERLTLHAGHDLLRRGEITSQELTQTILERIQAVDGRVQAYLRTTPELALEQARQADRRISENRRRGQHFSPLLGIPMAIKDVICTRGVETTCGSKILQGFVPPYNATAWARLRQAGAVLLGKTNTDEFAMGSSTENSGYFTTHNPWDLGRVPGGSSGGSAAALAAGECTYALGSDTGGSVRHPASLCGVVGLRPTYGRVSRYGLVAFASSLDQIGPITRDVTDCALVLGSMAGHDPQDATSLPDPVPDYRRALIPEVRGLRLGVAEEYLEVGGGMESGVGTTVRQAIARLEELGAEIVPISLPHTRYALPTYYLIATAEASANLARYDGVKYGFSYPAEDIWESYRRTRGLGFGAEVKRRIVLGTYALSAGYYDAYYLKAQKVRTLIKQDFDQAFQRCHALLAPTSPVVAFRIGERVDNPLQMYLADIYVLAQPLAGLPSISIPCGFSEELPVGLQIIGPPLGEEIILRVAYAYEQATPWHSMAPPLEAQREEEVP